MHSRHQRPTAKQCRAAATSRRAVAAAEPSRKPRVPQASTRRARPRLASATAAAQPRSHHDPALMAAAAVAQPVATMPTRRTRVSSNRASTRMRCTDGAKIAGRSGARSFNTCARGSPCRNVIARRLTTSDARASRGTAEAVWRAVDARRACSPPRPRPFSTSIGPRRVYDDEQLLPRPGQQLTMGGRDVRGCVSYRIMCSAAATAGGPYRHPSTVRATVPARTCPGGPGTAMRARRTTDRRRGTCKIRPNLFAKGSRASCQGWVVRHAAPRRPRPVQPSSRVPDTPATPVARPAAEVANPLYLRGSVNICGGFPATA